MSLMYRASTVTYRSDISHFGERVAVGTKRRTYDQRTSEYLVDLETGCWIWQRAKTKAGYGQVPIDGKMMYAHRVYYEDHVGPIPEGLVLDHLCKTPACCNPDHLEPVTQAENMRRARRSHCGRGHANSWREVGGYAVDPKAGCWIWQRPTSFNGYGQAWYRGKLYRAHRLFYELHAGPIPDGFDIDHKCGVKRCANPEHLEAATPRENVQRARRRRHEN